MTATWKVIHGSCLDELLKFDAESVDSIVTDAPYGLGKIPDTVKMLECWLSGSEYTPGKGGFMGREWDAFIPGPRYWREAIRVLKPGGYLLCFSGTRTVDLMGLAIRLAGFEIRDTIEFAYGSGFPKSLNVSKAIDRSLGSTGVVVGSGKMFGAAKKDDGRTGYGDFDGSWDLTKPETDLAKKWEGYGTALKPAHEPIIVARKPFTGTLVQNVLERGTGAMNIDGCRVAHANADDLAAHKAQVEAIKERGGSMADSWKNSSDLSGASDVTTAGRWPANLLMQHSADCQKVGLRTIGSNPTWDTPNRETESTFTGSDVSRVRHGDVITNFAMQAGTPIFEETVAEWVCVDGCPVKLMDVQSGSCVSSGGGGINKAGAGGGEIYGKYGTINLPPNVGKGDSGTASRYFQQFELDDFDLDPFYYCPKPARAERDIGLSEFEPASSGEATGRADDSPGTQSPRAGAGRKGGSRNIHPTVKSIALMRYLCRLVTPPGGTVLDPFCGSGSTGCGAVLEGFNFIGIELNDTQKEPFVSIARARIAHVLSPQYQAGRKTQAAPVPVGQMSLFG